MIQKEIATLLRRSQKDFFAADFSSKALFCTHYVGNVIYHNFSHGDVSYRFNGKNVSVMLE